MQTESQKRAKEKYNKKVYDFIAFRAPKGKKDIIDLYSSKTGLSINQYINLAIDSQLKKDGFNPPGEEKENEK